jgi:hypothetical protein
METNKGTVQQVEQTQRDLAAICQAVSGYYNAARVKTEEASIDRLLIYLQQAYETLDTKIVGG